MHVEKIQIKKENKFGDVYTVEREQLVYDSEREKLDAAIYNREHYDSYTDYCRRKMDSTLHVNTTQLFDSINEYFEMIDSMC